MKTLLLFPGIRTSPAYLVGRKTCKLTLPQSPDPSLLPYESLVWLFLKDAIELCLQPSYQDVCPRFYPGKKSLPRPLELFHNVIS